MFLNVAYVFPMTGTLGFVGSNFDYATLILHFFLSFSSLIFHVTDRRIVSNPLIIYQEYRLHAIIFTTKACLITLFGIFMDRIPVAPEHLRYVVGAIQLFMHLLVDYVTYLYGTPGITTVRNDDNGSIAHVKLFFAFYQVLAMASQMIVSDRLNDLGWNALIAIQSSAVLMTLKRKSLIRARTHFFWYSLALLLSMMYIWKAKGAMFFLTVVMMFILKIELNLNKYLMWFSYCCIMYYLGA